MKSHPSSQDKPWIIRAGSIKLDLARKEVTRDRKTKRIHRLERNILAYMMQNPNLENSHEQLYAVTGLNTTNEKGFPKDVKNIVCVAIGRIRQASNDPPEIVTFAGGYKFIELDTLKADLRFKNVAVDLTARVAKRGKRLLKLDNFTFNMLVVLLQKNGQPISAVELYRLSGGTLPPHETKRIGKIITVQMTTLRHELGEPNIIRTRLGQMYSLDAANPPKMLTPGYTRLRVSREPA